ncbi:hypothetical protein [Scatolibacter rhodanostii]|uniref:hypothetical protein n=1 Tax=Scatolibacter rhodanostii TaxID=2014781 RepID=UPI00117EB89F|nr:hypothetical protein [Scatolibacter rhodanostii]
MNRTSPFGRRNFVDTTCTHDRQTQDILSTHGMFAECMYGDMEEVAVELNYFMAWMTRYFPKTFKLIEQSQSQTPYGCCVIASYVC